MLFRAAQCDILIAVAEQRANRSCTMQLRIKMFSRGRPTTRSLFDEIQTRRRFK